MGSSEGFHCILQYFVVIRVFTSCALFPYTQDQHSTMVEYHVPVAPGGVADIFNQLESHKNALQIKHFSVSQTTLDEVRKRDRT